ncbi:M23 family metallopeptidase [Terriglobus aquaticus]|uniref:M23 family metallopeptidase n=1 Tax=Terriglobus aquaticus TaxID=940139 RepID=A0ABW9KLW8_9BACT|nr:M23 family metallopeptidase [Terriglobus aquaticus]
MKKRFYVVFVARESNGDLNRVSVPMEFVYLFVGAAVVGFFTIAGLAGSYSRMLLKTERFNQVRTERDTLRSDYAKLERREHEKEVQAASLGALAGEVSQLYGFTASKLAIPAGRLFHGKHAAPSSGTASGALIAPTPDSTLSTTGFQTSLDQLSQLKTSAMNGNASRAIASAWTTSPVDSFRSSAPAGFGPDIAIGGSTPTLWPVVGPISSPFGEREDPILGAGEGEFHKGLDISAPYGTPIRATAPGIVQMAGIGNGYGTEVVIDHGNGVRTIYGHMSGLHCTAGEQVVRGQVIGFVGHSGRTTGNHVHYEVRVHDVAVNPHKYLRATSTDATVLNAGL